MFLNIGAEINVFYKDIAAVINLEKMSGKINNEFIENLTKKNACTVIDKKKSRSLVILSVNGDTKAFLSPLSASSINNRLIAFNKILISSH